MELTKRGVLKLATASLVHEYCNLDGWPVHESTQALGIVLARKREIAE